MAKGIKSFHLLLELLGNASSIVLAISGFSAEEYNSTEKSGGTWRFKVFFRKPNNQIFRLRILWFRVFASGIMTWKAQFLKLANNYRRMRFFEFVRVSKYLTKHRYFCLITEFLLSHIKNDNFGSELNCIEMWCNHIKIGTHKPICLCLPLPRIANHDSFPSINFLQPVFTFLNLFCVFFLQFISSEKNAVIHPTRTNSTKFRIPHAVIDSIFNCKKFE